MLFFCSAFSRSQPSLGRAVKRISWSFFLIWKPLSRFAAVCRGIYFRCLTGCCTDFYTIQALLCWPQKGWNAFHLIIVKHLRAGLTTDWPKQTNPKPFVLSRASPVLTDSWKDRLLNYRKTLWPWSYFWTILHLDWTLRIRTRQGRNWFKNLHHAAASVAIHS